MSLNGVERIAAARASMKDQQETLFEAALKLTDAQQRAAFLEAACQGNPDLRRRLDDLLAAQPEADVFFQKRLKAEGPTVVTPLTERPGDRIGRYKLLQQIAKAGAAWSIWPSKRNRSVAVSPSSHQAGHGYQQCHRPVRG